MPVEQHEQVSAAANVPEAAEPARMPNAPETARLNAAEEVTEFLPVDMIGEIPRIPNLFRHPWKSLGWLIRMVFGIVSLILMLAVIAAVPVANFLALGYLMEIEGRMGRTGKLRFAFPLLDLAPRLGSIAIGVWLGIFPLRLLAGAAADARIIQPGGSADTNLHALTTIAAVLVTAHLCLALARGGSLACFFRPIKNFRWLKRHLGDGDYWQSAGQGVRDYFGSLRIAHHFWLGLQAFVGAFVWLFLPTALLAALQDTSKPVQVLLAILGGVLLVLVFSWLPFLQARFATEGRFRSMFEVRAVRELFRRAPLAWLTAIVLVFVLSLPLYLFKTVLPPQDALWGITIVFIVSVYPAKVLTGWAYHRAVRKTHRAWFGLGWISRTVMLPLLGLYVLLLFFTPAIGAHGKLVLFEHHAFLLPAPFFLFQ